MFTVVFHPETGESIQFKTGDDCCKSYSVGHILDQEQVDGVYIGLGNFSNKAPFRTEYWVVIKDRRIVAVYTGDEPIENIVGRHKI